MSSFEFNQKKFVKKISDFMKVNDISHRQFARMSGTSPMTFYRMRDETFVPTIATILKMEKAMNKYMEEIE